MKASLLTDIAGRLMRCPAAPYHESLVAREVRAICREHGLKAESDAFGNFLITVKRGAKRRRVVLAAHMDHPGFVIRRQLSATEFEAEFRGGVGDAYFRSGIKLRLMPQGAAATLGSRLDSKARIFSLSAAHPITGKPDFAVWELEDFAVRAGLIHGRACDDLIGVATILAVLIECKSQRFPCNVTGAITRAEEVGFHGALALAESGRLPKDALIISLETSREMPPVRIGGGVIIRAGDRASIFDSKATRFLSELAPESKIPFQRALMSGGTCEGTAFQEHGFQTAAVCVALGNYHNCAPHDRIEAEYVSEADANGMKNLLVCAAKNILWINKLAGRLNRRLAGLEREAVQQLKRQPLDLNG